jgi:transcriptional regulator with XRE-family HTH domain
MKPEEAFGTVMKSLRKEKKMSQEQLAHSCGLDRTFISLLERGQRQPSLRSILSIAASLELPADKLMKITVDAVEKGSVV